MANKAAIIQSLNNDFLKAWQKLWDESSMAHTFNSPQWFLAYCDTYNVKEYCLLFVENGGTLQAVLPLIVTRQFGVKVLCSPGGKFLDKSPLLLREMNPVLVRAIIKELMSMGSFYLRELSVELADAAMKANKRLIKQKASINYFVRLHPDPFEFVSKKQKSKIFNKMKRNEKHLHYKRYVGDPVGIEIAFAIEQKSVKKQKGKTTFNTEQDRAFFRELLEKNPNNFVVDVIFYDKTPFVYQIGLLYRNICQGVNTAYDVQYRHLSPGKVLLYFMLQQLQEEKRELFDFSRGESVIKREFTPFFYQQYDVIFAKHTVTKHWLLFIDKMRSMILNSKVLYGNYLAMKKIFL